MHFCRLSHSLAHPPIPAAPMAREIEVEVITVVMVGVRSEHRGERLAGAPVYRPQKRTLGGIAIPTREHGNLPSIRQPEGRDVKGVGQSMLRKYPPGDAVAGPA